MPEQEKNWKLNPRNNEIHILQITSSTTFKQDNIAKKLCSTNEVDF